MSLVTGAAVPLTDRQPDEAASYPALSITSMLSLGLAIGGHGKLHVVKGCDADAHAMDPSRRRPGQLGGMPSALR